MTQHLKQYSHFDTSSEMEGAAQQHTTLHWNKMTKSDRKVLEVIVRHSEEYGAAKLRYKTIEESTGRSTATVRRGINKLLKLNIIQKFHYFHPVRGGIDANIYVILPIQAP
ncbi:helix-turn-helix domain-containing protein [Sporosarcina highlanderae]|uniref:Uncharacterized protein n=1 Tax=Sporosarcina highlanderae TaxID=3035916 RepID=A0ABT8JL48_9BACL|nr:helix-turn-helix domain-containing protein [Sporosarcina highlanderae]MDN4605870.1 hypothetical protein [Sporosarcina highlanderae]